MRPRVGASGVGYARALVSFSSHRRNALDVAQPFVHRASLARSCAMLVARKLRVRRDVILEPVKLLCGVDMTAPGRDADIATAIAVLEDLRHGRIVGEQDPYRKAGT